MRLAAPVLGRGWPSIAEACRAYDAAVGPLLDQQRKQGDEMIPAQHACTPGGNLHPSFVPTDEIKSVARVTLFLEGWSEDRVAVETKHGFFLAEGPPLDTTSFNDPGCFGHTMVTVQSVRAATSTRATAPSSRRRIRTTSGGTASSVRSPAAACAARRRRSTGSVTSTRRS
jgi:hypothetical protein